MAEPINLDQLRPANDVTISRSGSMGKGGGGMDGTEVRLKRLEEDGKEIRSDLKSIMTTLAEMKGTLSGLATKGELGEVKVAVAKLEIRVEKLPTMGRVSLLLGICVAAITIVVRWSELGNALVSVLRHP
ncbi:hypothetical protein [Devosia sp.]|uniref:hypothetical protein n=1 Tax=Devosia sp. TaxID=1871048 RepID=UPI0032667B9A